MNVNNHREQKIELLLGILQSMLSYVRRREVQRKLSDLGLRYSKYQPTDEELQCLQESYGYFWLNEEFRKGKSRAEIILAFNRNRKADPENYYTPDGRPMTISLFKTCVTSCEDMFPDMNEESAGAGEYLEDFDLEFQPDSIFEFND